MLGFDNYYKLIDSSMINNNFQFVNGLNVDKNNFNLSECGPNGIYFCMNMHDINSWIGLHENDFLWSVTVPDDAEVIVFKKKVKCNKIILNYVLSFNDLIEYNIKNSVINPMTMLRFAVSYNEEISRKMIIDAINFDDKSFAYIPKNLLTNEIILSAININPSSIEDIPRELWNDEIILFAVKKCGNILRFLQNYLLETKKTNDIILAALNNNGIALQHVPNEMISKQHIITALKNQGLALQFVPNKFINKIIIHAAIKENPYALQYVPVDKMSEKIILYAVKKLPNTLQYVPDNKKTDEIILAAVRRNGTSIKYVQPEKMTDDIIIEALNNNIFAINSVPNELISNKIASLIKK